MRAETVRQDATDSTRGTIYHLCVAVNKCYDLQEGQKLLIEELGDVTIEGDQQIEVKHYSDRLTDGHPNLWNTLANWMSETFDATPYTALILHTTQEFGQEATIANWNEMNSGRRLEALLAINKKFEAHYEKAKAKDPSRIPSAVLKHQRFVLNPDKQLKLQALIGKVCIEARARELPDLYQRLREDRIRGILSGKKDDYLDSLIGFVCRANKQAGERWEITYDEFNAKLSHLTATYHKETRLFPKKYFAIPPLIDEGASREDLFVQKIKEIQYDQVICRAIHDYEATISTVNKEFREYGIDGAVVDDYATQVVERFKAYYRKACRHCSDELVSSQDLYDDTIGSPATPLLNFGDTPDGFRNGLLHIRMNNPATNLKWRVKKQ